MSAWGPTLASPRACARAEPAPLYVGAAGGASELGNFRVAVGDALAGPDLRQRHESLREDVALAAILGHGLRRQAHLHLMEHDLDAVRELVALLADDRHLAGLG